MLRDEIVTLMEFFSDSPVGIEESYFFFFSSRRRHTRLTCDWSSDVCSSDLQADSMSQAMLRKDHAALADLTHPAVVRAVGGREKFLAILERMDAELRGRGLSFSRVI